VSRFTNFTKGSKRRVRQIRWTPFEIVSAIALLVGALVLTFLLALWVVSHPLD
jgi:uncharacterized membrane protein YiaA